LPFVSVAIFPTFVDYTDSTQSNCDCSEFTELLTLGRNDANVNP